MHVSLALALASSVHAVNLGVKFTGHMNLHLSVLSQNLASNCRNAELSAGIMTCQQAADSNNITLTAFSKLNPSMDCTLPLQDRTLFCVPDDFSPSVHGLPMLSNATTTADIHATGTTIFTGTIAAVARETSLATGSSALTTSTSESTTTTTESTTVDPTATTTSVTEATTIVEKPSPTHEPSPTTTEAPPPKKSTTEALPPKKTTTEAPPPPPKKTTTQPPPPPSKKTTTQPPPPPPKKTTTQPPPPPKKTTTQPPPPPPQKTQSPPPPSTANPCDYITNLINSNKDASAGGVVNMHNAIRQYVSSVRGESLPAARWDDAVASQATVDAQWSVAHTSCQSGGLAHNPDFGITDAKNLGWSNFWYAMYQFVTYDDGGGSECQQYFNSGGAVMSHFTNMMHGGSRVGCGAGDCPGGQFGPVIGCDYAS